MKKVFVGMSGGVDSSVTAALLVEQGYDVTGVFMKNWAQDLPGFKCPWREDLADAKRVAVQLGIPFKIFDFQTEYKQKVVDYMIEEYQAGRTPNPDIMCNQEVKFKLFLETAFAEGADMIATGHYARICHSRPDRESSKQLDTLALLSGRQDGQVKLEDGISCLQQAVDENKDQTYFLYRVTSEALAHTLFPLGTMTKPEVRRKAHELGLITATKKDSVGICFVGEIGIKEFLQNFVKTEPGNVIEKSTNKVLGRHEGAIFYTVGQRHGLNIGGGLPYYVIGKDMQKNKVYVSTDLDDPELWHRSIRVSAMHWITAAPEGVNNLTVRVRHRGPLIPVELLRQDDNDTYELELKDPIRALAPGQSAVLYQDGVCLGGGVII